MSEPDCRADYIALREDVGAVLGEREMLKASGPDAQNYLDGQLSQDITALDVGKSGWSFILQPTGKVDVYCRVFHSQMQSSLGSSNEAAFYIEVPVGYGELALSRLRRFKLRVDCELELLRWQFCAIRGTRSAEAVEIVLSETSSPALVAQTQWSGAAGFDLLGTDLSLPAIRECSSAALEALRIEAGMPLMGKDIAEGAIPAEVGNRILNEAVSFTKGCYAGQELVARVESRGGNVPKRLLGVMFEGSAGTTASSSADSPLPEAGDPLHEAADPARQVGTLTSFALSPRLGSIGLALIHRSVDPPARLVCDDRCAEVVDLPFPNST